MNTNFDDVGRLQLLMQRADQSLKDAEDELVETQVDIAKEKTQYFEKLAIGSGAAIAAIVSFLGTHNGKLEPTWILRCSLISLVIAMVAALYRNFRYPNYVLAVKNCRWIEASRYQQQCKNSVFHAEQDAIDIHSGALIDLQKWKNDFQESDVGLAVLIHERTERVARLTIEWQCAESVCLASVSIAMISLVWLALRNF
jgi:hypothetical protein